MFLLRLTVLQRSSNVLNNYAIVIGSGYACDIGKIATGKVGDLTKWH